MGKFVLRSSAVVLALCFSSGAVLAQQKMDPMKGMDMGSKPAATAAAATTHSAKGLVKKVDPNAGRVTLAHGPVKSMNWPAMEMGFEVKDKAMLDKLKVGQEVDFQFQQDGKRYVVTSVQ